MKSADNTVHIIGAGWSGLACAVVLAEAGIPVVVLESAPQAGGRARTVRYKKSLSSLTLDNGQHIMLGAYHNTLQLFRRLGINEQDVLIRQTLGLTLYSTDHPVISLKTPALPAPLHLIYALLNFNNIIWLDRFKVIRMLIKLRFQKFRLQSDISVHELLHRHLQPDIIIQALWEPLCLGTMNTPVKQASAQVFLHVLEKSFNQRTQASDLLFFKTDLSSAFCEPAVAYIKQKGGQVLLSRRVRKIESINPSRSGSRFIIHTKNSQLESSQLVLATPAHITAQLQQQNFNLIPADSSLNFFYEPICTIYLQYPEKVLLPQIMSGFFDSVSQWAIDHSVNQQPGLIAVVISSSGKHLQRSHQQLADVIHNELKLIINNLPHYLDYQVVIDKKATFNCHVNINAQRPDFITSCRHLYLAGDYTSTGYPATLEGAVTSGIKAAHYIIGQH